ncbi:MAG: TIGR02300 family protein [Rhizobiales bacterium]|nr:TIGR02300 family protein [Hyphomicrobiales bacterium]
MAKPELGTKRVCQSCGAKFYDLSKDPITCPKCGAVYEIVVPVTRGGRPTAAAAAAAAAAGAAKAKTEATDRRMMRRVDFARRCRRRSDRLQEQEGCKQP